MMVVEGSGLDWSGLEGTGLEGSGLEGSGLEGSASVGTSKQLTWSGLGATTLLEASLSIVERRSTTSGVGSSRLTVQVIGRGGDSH